MLKWERLRVAVPIVVDVTGRTLKDARAAVAAAKADDWRTPYQAAGFCMAYDVAPDEGRQWLEKSLGIQQTFANLGLKARWQAKDGHKDEAIVTAGKALELAKTAKDKPDTAPLEKLVAEWKSGK